MREKVPCVLLLKGDDALVELVNALVCPWRARRHSIALVEVARDVQVHVDVDSALLKGGHQVVHALEPRGVKRALRLRVQRQYALLGRHHEVAVALVHVVKPHAVESETRKPRGEAFGLLVRREVRRARQVRCVEADAPFVVDEMSAFNPDASAIPRGCI